MASSSTSSSNLMIRTKIISPIEKRKDQFLTNVIENVNKEIRQMYFPDKFLQKLKQNCFYAITNAKIGSAINVGQYSKVMESKPFPYDVEVEKAFLNPPVVSVAEALASPSKRRLSLSGRFEGSSQLYENEYSKRRILNISGNGTTIAVKLWGDKSDLQMPEKKNNITIHGLEMSDFRGKLEANSTSTTLITVEDEEEDPSAIMEGEVEAACFDESDSSIVLCGKCLAIDSFLLGQIFKESHYVENVHVKVRQEAKRVEEIITIEVEEYRH